MLERPIPARTLCWVVAAIFGASVLVQTAEGAGSPPCERYALHELRPGMSHDLIRLKMGGDGLKTLVHTPGRGDAWSAYYPGPSADVLVQYDHRFDRRPPARAVLVRVPLPLSPASVEALVERFGPPQAGADDLEAGLQEGAAVWVDDRCGVVLTAYRVAASWWTAESGTNLQLETLELARRGDSPASPRLNAILAARSAPAQEAPRSAPSPIPPSPVEPPPLVVTGPPPPAEARSEPAALIPSPPQTIATWHAPAPAASPVSSDVEAHSSQAPGTTGIAKSRPDAPAERITFVPPTYPPTAKWLGLKGHVTLAIIVRADGTVAGRPGVVAVRPAGRGFEEAAIEAVRNWRFRPATRGGRPVESNLAVDVEFE